VSSEKRMVRRKMLVMWKAFGRLWEVLRIQKMRRR